MSANQRILLGSLFVMALVFGLLSIGGSPSSPAAGGNGAAEGLIGAAEPGPAITAATTASTTPSTVSTTAAPVPTAAATTAPAPAPSTAPAPTAPATTLSTGNAQCPESSHGAVIDRERQRAWLCENGVSTGEFPITTARTQPLPGTYKVYAKDLKASSNFGGHYSTMTHFVAFTKGRYTGARVAFHSVPKLSNGKYVQPFDSVGTEAYHGESSGCIRVVPDQAVEIWNWLGKGDQVVVIN